MMSINNISNDMTCIDEPPENITVTPDVHPVIVNLQVQEQDAPAVKKSVKRISSKAAGKKQKSNENEIMSKSKLRKFLRNTGQEYITKKGKVVKAKIFDDKDCGCSRRCKTKILTQDRQKCFDKFWKMGDFGKQNAYLSGLVTREAVKQHRPRLNCTNRGPKGVTYQYRINVGRVSKPVCKKYFLQTYLVSDGRLSRALRKEENEKEPSEDLRGRKPPANKTSEEQLNRVRDHINSFLRYDSNYSINPKGKYLKSDLNVKKMYGMYVDNCSLTNVPHVKENIYRSVFKDEFSLTFLSPRRDHCNHVHSEGRTQKVKKANSKSNMLTESMQPAPSVHLSHSKYPTSSQLFCPTDSIKCSYTQLTGPPQTLPHDNKNYNMQCYPTCNDMQPHNYFSQDQTIHNNYPIQASHFYNL